MKILIVEDDVDSREILADVLVNLGHDVRACGLGEEAIESSKKIKYQLLLTDIGLPDINGWTVAQMVRRRCPGIVIYAVSAWDTVLADVTKRHLKVVDGYLPKPYDLKDIEKIVNRCAERQNA